MVEPESIEEMLRSVADLSAGRAARILGVSESTVRRWRAGVIRSSPAEREAARSAAFAERVAQWRQWRTEHGRDARWRRGVDPETDLEQSLALWLRRARRALSLGTLPEDRAEALDAVDPGWRTGVVPPRTDDDVWAERRAAWAGFREQHGRDPSPVGSIPGERALAFWLTSQREQLDRADREAAMVAVDPRWREPARGPVERERRFYARLHAWREFYTAKGFHPRKTSHDKEEATLGRWLANRRQDARTGVMSADRAAAMETVDPEWRTVRNHTSNFRDEPWIARLHQWRAFLYEHGRAPSERALDPAERSLGTWLRHQHRKRRRGLLPPEAVAALDAFLSPRVATPAEQAARDAQIARLRGEGWRVADIATQVGLSAPRVSQILSRLGLGRPRLPRRHGTLAMYRRGRCRCDACRAANAAAVLAAKYRRRERAGTPVKPRRYWTDGERAKILNATEPDAVLAARLGRTLNSLRSERRKLRLRGESPA